jgi:hypothetical protein
MDPLVMILTMSYAAAMTVAAVVAVVTGSLNRPIPITVEEESHR